MTEKEIANQMKAVMAKNIQKFLDKKGKTQTDMAKELEFPEMTVSNWLLAKTYPRLDKIQAMADYFGVYRSDLQEDKDALVVETKIPGAIPIKSATATFPVYAHISAGTAIEMIPVDEYVGVPDAIAAKYPNAFFFKVNGDSMDKVIPDGALAMINVCDEAIDNDVVAVTINGNDATLKRLHKFPNGIMLMPESNNEAHSKVMFDCSKGECDEVRIIGKLVWHMIPFDTKY